MSVLKVNDDTYTVYDVFDSLGYPSFRFKDISAEDATEILRDIESISIDDEIYDNIKYFGIYDDTDGSTVVTMNFYVEEDFERKALEDTVDSILTEIIPSLMEVLNG